MFGTLFWKECKQTLRSLVYYIYVVIFVLFLTSQMNGDMAVGMRKPVEGEENYGTTLSKDHRDIMEHTLAELSGETSRNSYATYPMGFYKQVILNEKELAEVKQMIADCAGRSWEKVLQETTEYFTNTDQSTMDGAIKAQNEFVIKPAEDLSYEAFCRYMEKVCDRIGKGSSYEKTRFDSGVSVPMDYETAIREFEALTQKDHVTGAVERLFCDYAGIVLAVLPIFLAVSRCLRDKRTKVSQVIYARKASSPCIIGSRYAALVCMAFLPVVITAFVTQLPFQYHARTLGASPDTLAFLKYTCGWLLPEIMAVMAIAFLITELTQNVLAILIQSVWAVASLFVGNILHGNFGLQLIARWNMMGGTLLFEQQKAQLWQNRLFYTGLSVLALLLTFVVYEKKRRKGGSIFGKV